MKPRRGNESHKSLGLFSTTRECCCVALRNAALIALIPTTRTFHRLALPLCLLYRPQLIAAASFVLACAQLDQPLPPSPGSLSEQRALHELEIQEAEEGEEPAPFVPRMGWMDLLEINPEELRGGFFEAQPMPRQTDSF